jgi:hypothetical protein
LNCSSVHAYPDLHAYTGDDRPNRGGTSMAEGLGNYWGARIVHPYRYLDGLADDR